MKVNEIFTSIEGEGIRTGYPATFIRLYGCNLHCSYCDTRYSCENDEGTEMSIDEIINKVSKFGVKRVTLTGGEPLIHTDVDTLIHKLTKFGYEINIETNGSVDIQPYTSSTDVQIITMDYKSISSGMSDRMCVQNLDCLRPCDVLKFVVGTKEDLEDMKRVVLTYEPHCNIFVSPIFGQIELVDIVNFIEENKLNECRLQVQLHKLVWDPNKRGV